jgi:hypothetical protein
MREVREADHREGRSPYRDEGPVHVPQAVRAERYEGVRSITFTRHPGSRGHDIKHVMLNGVMIGWITLNRPTEMFQFSEIGDEVHSTIQSSDVRSS